MLNRKRIEVIYMDVEKTREARRNGVVAFAKFCNDKKGHEDYLFCFFEGEDNKYYGSRIEKYTEYPSRKIINYNCGGRKEVERAYTLISKKEEYDKINKCFFIDSDYISSELKATDIYQTPCYSIENFYSSYNCLGKILTIEFGINSIDKDYQMCINDYLERQKEFHNYTNFLNIWLFCQRIKEEKNKNHAIMLSNFKVSKYFSIISIEKMVQKNDINKELLESEFPSHYDVSEEEINEVKNIWKTKQQQKIYRGKFEMEFLRKILESLIQHNKSNSYFSEKHTCVKLNATSNLLSTLSTYADTPSCLITFLKKHKYTSANKNN